MPKALVVIYGFKRLRVKSVEVRFPVLRSGERGSLYSEVACGRDGRIIIKLSIQPTIHKS